jgi:hypothetical protein
VPVRDLKQTLDDMSVSCSQDKIFQFLEKTELTCDDILAKIKGLNIKE